ncbi:MAG: S24 family peptidase [Chromatiales bacterium]|nr:S24 family peptidase [Chromatiales bacterium]
MKLESALKPTNSFGAVSYTIPQAPHELTCTTLAALSRSRRGLGPHHPMKTSYKDPGFRERLAQLVGTDQPFAWAGRVGISKGAFSRIWRQGTVPGPELLRRIQDATGISLDWLLTGQEPMYPGHRPAEGFVGITQVLHPDGIRAAESPDNEYVTVPLHPHHAAAGHGPALGDEHLLDALAFRRGWIQSELHANPHDLYLLYVEGESMEPVLRSRDLVLVDRREADRVPHDGIYAVRVNGTLLIKRVQRLPGDRLQLTSENPAYQPIAVNGDELQRELEIIGRVIWVGRRL